MLKKIFQILLVFIMVMAGGCSVVSRPPKKTMVPVCSYVRPGTFFNRIGKVALFEPIDNTVNRDISDQVTDSIANELRKLHTFSISVLERDEPGWYYLKAAEDGFYDLQQLAAIRRELNVNAVIFGSITQFETYPQLTIGLRMRMLDLRSGNILWGIEQVWDSTDVDTQCRMNQFYARNMRCGYEPMGAELVRTSPRMFYKFVSTELAGTIPAYNQRRW